MPKKIHKIERFEGGLVNNYNKRDIPENSLFNAVDVMVDVEGRVRMMGRDSLHALFGSLEAKYSPGYGLFAFNADYSYSNFSLVGSEATGSKFLLIQCKIMFHLFDVASHIVVITLANADGTANESGIIPEFFYADGAVRVCDGRFESNVGIERNSQNQWFGPIKKSIFAGVSFNSPSNDPGHDINDLSLIHI